MQGIRLIIITGMSGAGKSEAVRCFEDLGYFCVDNLPPKLIGKFAELIYQSQGKIREVAVVSDVRGGGFFDHLLETLKELEREGISYNILFLEASDEVLVRRFKETRRPHPLAEAGSLLQGIAEERKRLEEVRGRAHLIIDTSHMSPRQLKGVIAGEYAREGGAETLDITILSFGFKHGVPVDVDLLFDVRFLPNPHYVESLRPLTGEDKEVRDYVYNWPLTHQFQKKLEDFVDFLIPQYIREGKSGLVIGIGCTGGRHRSVAVAEVLGKFLNQAGYQTRVIHRDAAGNLP
ncbi:MAG: RNase adapter RapZ [Limnochordia bacterium]